MGRIRTIKPDFCTSSSVAKLSRDARLFFLLLLTDSDDEGRLVSSPKRLAGLLFPHDEDVTAVKVRRWIDSCQKVGMIQTYSVNGGDYIQIVNFEKHQRISHKSPSRLPPPPENLQSDSGKLPEPPPNGSGAPPESFRPDLGSGSGSGSSSSSLPKDSGEVPERSDDELNAEVERRYQAQLSRGAVVANAKAWKAKARKNLLAEVAAEGRGVLRPPPAKPPDPAESTAAAQRERAERNDARLRGEVCIVCDGTGWQEKTGGVVPCRNCRCSLSVVSG